MAEVVVVVEEEEEDDDDANKWDGNLDRIPANDSFDNFVPSNREYNEDVDDVGGGGNGGSNAIGLDNDPLSFFNSSCWFCCFPFGVELRLSLVAFDNP